MTVNFVSRVSKKILGTSAWLFIAGQSFSSVQWIRLFSYQGINLGIFHVLFLFFCTIILLLQALNTNASKRFYIFTLHSAFVIYAIQPILFLLLLFDQVSLRDFLRQFSYFIISICLAYLIFFSDTHTKRVLSLSSTFLCFTFLISFSIYASTVPNILDLLWLGIKSGDSSLLIFGIFRRVASANVFDTTLDHIRANIRHDIASSALFASFTSLTFLPSQKKQFIRGVILFTSLISFSLTFILLSRAAIVSAVLAVIHLMILHKPKLRLRPGWKKDFKKIFFIVTLLFVVLGIFFGRLLMTRFIEDTKSYSERIDRLSGSLNLLASSSFFFPADRDQSMLAGNSHIWSIELWKVGGIIGLLAGLALTAFLLRSIFTSSTRFENLQQLMGFDSRFAVALLWLPVVRLHTAGSALSTSEWLSIGLFIGTYIATLSRPKSMG